MISETQRAEPRVTNSIVRMYENAGDFPPAKLRRGRRPFGNQLDVATADTSWSQYDGNAS